MKISGKLLSAALASVLVFSLAGCGDKEESKTFNANLAGTEISITYTYKGDKNPLSRRLKVNQAMPL